MIGWFNLVKISLTAEQVEKLLAWLDQHNDLVRALVVPFDDCCILCENGIKVSVKRDKTLKSLYAFCVANTKTHDILCRFNVSVPGCLVSERWIGKKLIEYDVFQSGLTIRATVSAYIVNFQPELVEVDHKESNNGGATVHKAIGKAANKPADRVVYLKPIVYSSSQENPVKRKYTPCENAFSVRGHYRHYKSGKVVYVQPYEKNTGKEKDKRNKVLKIMEV